MPVPGLFSAYYWPGDGVQNGTPPPAQVDQYNFPWRGDGAMLNGGLFVAPPPIPRSWRKALTRFQTRIVRSLPGRLVAAWFLLQVIFSRDFSQAAQVVRDVAENPSTRDLNTWGDFARVKVSNPQEAENVLRSLHARIQMKNSPFKAILLELAWLTRKAQH